MSSNFEPEENSTTENRSATVRVIEKSQNSLSHDLVSNVHEKQYDKLKLQGPSDAVNLSSVAEPSQSVSFFTAAIMSTNDQKLCSQSVRLSSVKKVASGAPFQLTDSTNNCQDSSSMIQTTQSSTFVTASASPATAASATCHFPAFNLPLNTRITSTIPGSINSSTASNNIPVGIAVARQRYVSSSSCKTQTQNLKESMTTSSSNPPYMPSIPYHQAIIEPSLFPQIGVVAGPTACDDRTAIAGIGGNIFPSIIAWPPQQQQIQPWYSCAGLIETTTQNIPSPCAGYQLVRDPVSGNIILIPANQIGSAQPSITGFTSASQQIQSVIIPSQYHHQQSQTHSVILDHLVSVVPSGISTKQNSISSTLLKLNDGILTGVMMPCDLTKSTTVNPSCATAAIGQQVISANNSSISLVHQFNSSNIQNANINSPHHFSSISSSGSLLIQRISGNTGQPPVINHINNSVMIAESTAMQSVINTQPSYLINSPVSVDNSTIQPPTCIVNSNSRSNEILSNPLPNVNDSTSCVSKPPLIQFKVNNEKQVHLETKPFNEQVCFQQLLFEEKNGEENAMIKVKVNSCVQDASNQTEDNDDEDIGGNDEPAENSENEEEKGDSECEDAINSCINKSTSRRKVDEKVYSDENPDFSGLQLLLNGIERAEHCITDASVETIVKEDTDDDAEKPAPNGLEILCALANQRFQEEKKTESDVLEEKRKLYTDLKTGKREVRHSYKNLKSDHLLSSRHERSGLKSSFPCDTDSLQVRLELAKLQKKYRETRKELSRLTHRKCSPSNRNSSPALDNRTESSTPIKRKPGRPRKYKENDVSSTQKPPKLMERPKLKLDTEVDYFSPEGSEEDVKVSNSNNGDLSPPVLEPMCTSPKEKSSFTSDILSHPPILIANKKLLCMGDSPKGLPESAEFDQGKTRFRLTSDTFEEKEVNGSDLIPILPKRKVGRPRKYPKESNDSKPAKISRKTNANKMKERKSECVTYKYNEKQIPVTSSVVSTLAMIKLQKRSSNTEMDYKPKITPKLKAEAKLRTWRQESPELIKDDLEYLDFKPKKKKLCEHNETPYHCDEKKSAVYKKSKKFPLQDTKGYSGAHLRTFRTSTTSGYRDEDFRITAKVLDSIEQNPVRVLISVGGLFRAGVLSAVRPPDIYGIRLDGERGQKTHIYTKEDILKNVVREVKGKYPLQNGTRVCAFWSSQYLSLYPGYVSSFSSSDESEDENFTAVEFDDGDSGRINVNDIRILPKDFSVIRHTSFECLEESKRRTSSINFDEIPVDKTLCSPDRSLSHRPPSNKTYNTGSSPPVSSATDSVSSRTSSDEVQESTRAENVESNENTESIEASDKKKNEEHKRLKKKHKDKVRDSSNSSCKRKSHKYRSGAEEISTAKAHKRHKHKHKHHKHHKRKRSSSTHKFDEVGDRSVPSEKPNLNFDADVMNRKEGQCDKFEEDESDWTYVPPYSSHLIDESMKIKIFSAPKIRESSQSNVVPQRDLQLSGYQSKTDENVSGVAPIGMQNGNDSDEDSDDEDRLVVVETDKSSEASADLEPLDKTTLQINEKTDEEISLKKDAPSLENPTSLEKGECNTTDIESNSSEEKYWDWNSRGTKRNGKGRARKEFHKSIKRRDEIINVGDCAVFWTAGSSAKPFIGRIECMWEMCNKMMVSVNWFYHPEETIGLTQELPFLGGLFESSHSDKNEVQTISHKCKVVTFAEYRKRLEEEPERLKTVYESNDLYYLAGYYDPTAKSLMLKDDVVL